MNALPVRPPHFPGLGMNADADITSSPDFVPFDDQVFRFFSAIVPQRKLIALIISCNIRTNYTKH